MKIKSTPLKKSMKSSIIIKRADMYINYLNEIQLERLRDTEKYTYFPIRNEKLLIIYCFLYFSWELLQHLVCEDDWMYWGDASQESALIRWTLVARSTTSSTFPWLSPVEKVPVRFVTKDRRDICDQSEHLPLLSWQVNTLLHGQLYRTTTLS